MPEYRKGTPDNPKVTSFAEFMVATGGTGRHTRLCLRCADGPDYVGRSTISKCVYCKEDVWYDPKATIYAPGEIITCMRCYAAAVKAAEEHGA